MVISPGLSVGSGSRRGRQPGLCLCRILGYRHVNPLLGARNIVASIPVALGDRIGGFVGDLDVCDSIRHVVDRGCDWR